ncbi:hypothetical protein ABLE93_10785 [Xanthobacter sp. KR7-65]|uniref:hypothetical protein n=1 Tax=Xanthobacter sp. KR7-65 TaxID=3156612 RepID=UPI0032B5B33C
MKAGTPSLLGRVLRALSVCALAGAPMGVLGAGAADAQSIPPPNCTAPNDSQCYKEIRIVNNTDATLYAVIQGSRQTNPALNNCTEGDVWLQRALNDTTKCYKVDNDYYIYVNPKTGIPKGETVSVMLPWWSNIDVKKTLGGDAYVDWWRGGRIYLFDDKTALEESYKINTGAYGQKVVYVAGNGPKPKCTPQQTIANKCVAAELGVYMVRPLIPGSAIQGQTPYQLNEWTFADVAPLGDGGQLQTLMVNYNVSNVDQLYLPVAVAAIRPGNPVGYMGTTMSVGDFRTRLIQFTGANADQTNATKWPIYNNPINKKTNLRKYPNAGIRVPSALLAFNYYMSPSYVDGNTALPEMLPLPKPYDRTKLPTDFYNIFTNWQNCTTAPYTNCPLKDWYAPIKQAFDASYASYLKNCYKPNKSPAYMKPESNNLPKIETYLRFLHGWVPFRVDNFVGPNAGCSNVDVPDLPQTTDSPAKLGVAPVNYMKLQYDFEQLGMSGARRFNPYTQLIHGSTDAGYLNASSYAFSIDDHESFQKFEGTGLVFAVGGPNGLPLNKRVPPALPPAYDWYTASVTPGYQQGTTGWKAYGLCSETANREFPNDVGGVIGLNPRTTPAPCTVTFEDTTGKLFKLKILKFNATGSLPYQIWPQFEDTPQKPFDPTVMSCPNPNDDWCKYTNERARISDPEKGGRPTFSLSARKPN